MQTRPAVQAAIRGIAIMLLLVAVGITMWRILDVLINWPYVQGHRPARVVWHAVEVRVKEAAPAVLTLCMTAIALWLLQRPLSRLIAPVGTQARTCPQCGYDLCKLESDRCPECGAEIRSVSKPTPEASKH